MAFIKYERCGKSYSDKADTCPFCNASTQPAELGEVETFSFELSPQDQDRPSPLPDPHGQIILDCRACNSQKTMIKDKVPRFNGVVRAIGVIILIPSFIGVGISLLGLFATCSASHEVMQTAEMANSSAYSAGAAIGAAISGGFFLFIGASSFVGGLLGWLLLLTRKVFRCTVCGHIIDRA